MLLQCEGPKLHPFFNRESDTQIVRPLSNDEQDEHSHVFEVIINGVNYALKVVASTRCPCSSRADATSSSNSLM